MSCSLCMTRTKRLLIFVLFTKSGAPGKHWSLPSGSLCIEGPNVLKYGCLIATPADARLLASYWKDRCVHHTKIVSCIAQFATHFLQGVLSASECGTVSTYINSAGGEREATMQCCRVCHNANVTPFIRPLLLQPCGPNTEHCPSFDLQAARLKAGRPMWVTMPLSLESFSFM